MCEQCDKTIWRNTMLDLAFRAGQQSNAAGRRIIASLVEVAPVLTAEIRQAAMGGAEYRELQMIDAAAEQLRSPAPLTRAQAARALTWWAEHGRTLPARQRAHWWLDAARQDDEAVVRAATITIPPRSTALSVPAYVGA